MAVSHVASAQGFTGTTTRGGNIPALLAGTGAFSFTYTATTTGNAVLIWVAAVPTATSPTGCTLSATGWTFAQLGGIVNGGASAGCGAMFVALAPNTSLATVTATFNQNITSFANDLIDEFSGADSTTPTAGNNSATGSGTPTVSVTPTANNCMIWVPCNDSVTAVGNIGGSAATAGANDTQQDWSEYRLLSGQSGAAQSCSVTGSGSYIIGAVAIQPAIIGPTIGSVPSGTALATPAFTAPFLFFDTGDFSTGV